ncbi:MAG: hypothetical protein ACOYT4_01000 [Nanoarchaeota archaeon]
MRKIKTQEEIEKKEKKKELWIVSILILLLIFSVVGYGFLSTDKKNSEIKKFNGIKFEKINGIWTTKINEQQLYFQYFPSETDDVIINGFFNLKDYENQPLYIVNSNEASYEITQNIGEYALRINEACLQDTNCTDPSLARKNCDSNIIIFEEKFINETRVYQDKNCIHISGNYIKGADAFLYRLLEIK